LRSGLGANAPSNVPEGTMRHRKLVHCVSAGLALGTICIGSAALAAGPDEASSRCFEIIVPQRQTQPDSPLLFNKCTGATWLLVRSHKWNGKSRGYRWVSLEVDNLPRVDQSTRIPPSATATPEAKPPITGEKCFEFTGRRFCE
jgi:hypothetical protein